MKRAPLLVTFAGMVLGAAGPSLAQPAAKAAAPVLYTVKRGDTFFDLGRRFLAAPGDYVRLQRANPRAAPRQLVPGSTVTLPYGLLRAAPIAATIVSHSGDVHIMQAGVAMAPVVGGSLAQGSTITTGPNAFLTLQLADESRITLPSNSALTLTRLRKIVADGRLERDFDLHAGRIQAQVPKALKPADRFLVRTPVVVAAVRGTEYRVAFDGQRQTASIGVIAGTVWVSDTTPLVTVVEAGRGAASRNGTIGAPATLLAGPKLLDTDRVQSAPEVVFTAAPESPGSAFRIQLARDAGFVDLFAETVANDRTARFAGVGNGVLFVRATAIDADGVEGQPTTYAFDRQQVTLTGSASPAPNSRGFLFRWSAAAAGELEYRFVLATDAALTRRIVDEPGLSKPELLVSNLAPGTYYWRVGVIQRIGDKTFETLPPPTELNIPAIRR